MNLFLLLPFIICCFFIIHIERNYSIPYIKWIFIIPFCLIVACRSIKVPDTQMYFEYFNLDNSDLLQFNYSSFEIGFQIFTKLAKTLVNNSYFLYLGFITLLNLLIINFSVSRIGNLFRLELENNEFIQDTNPGNRFYTNSSFAILPLTLYAAFYGIYVNAIIVRIGITFSLVVLASTFALKGKRNILDYSIILFLLSLGYLFHSTAIIGGGIIIILFSKIKFSKEIYLWIWFFIGLIYFTNFSTWLANTVFTFMLTLNNVTVLATKLSNYDGNVIYQGGGIAMKFMFYWVMAFFLIIYSLSSSIYFKIINVYLIGLLIFALFRSVLLVERVTDYFLLFSFIIFYLFLIMQKTFKFWLYFIPIVIIQLVFVLRITN